VIAGKLDLPTGNVVAADPFVNLRGPGLDASLAPGLAEVVIALSGPERSASNAFAMVHVGAARPVRWRALEKQAYAVDSGKGCFVDAATGARIVAREEHRLTRAAALVSKRVPPQDAERWHAAIQEELSRTPDLYSLMAAQSPDGGEWRRWTSLCIDPASGANIVVFTSGVGDGVYGTYAGSDASGRVVALVTDFGVGTGEEDEHPPSHR
jgi:hypothetical protein